MNIVIAPGAFKHSLSATAAAQAIAAGLQRSMLQCVLHYNPIADGGNDTLRCFLINGGQEIDELVLDPLQRPITAPFGLLPDGETAVIEMALASGLELLHTGELNPLAASTYGTGVLMQAALDRGAKRVIVGMGGSATVDGGAGCLQALGVRLLDADDHDIAPGSGGLGKLHRIDTSGLDPRWHSVDLVIASDVDNPTLGPHGAAAVFGPQKGASPADVITLEANLTHFFTLVAQQVGVDVRTVRGGGAAGAFSAGLMAFLGGHIESGIDLLLDYHQFDRHLATADLVITGEGQMDAQTVHGKGPMGVARRAKAHGVPTVAIVGSLNIDDETLHDSGITAVVPIVTRPMALDQALADAALLVEHAALRLGYLLQLRRF